MAGWTGLEPAAFRVTGGRYNQLNYHPAKDGAGKHEAKDITNRSPGFNGFVPILNGILRNVSLQPPEFALALSKARLFPLFPHPLSDFLGQLG